MILLAEHDEPTSLAAKKKRQHGASSRPTSTPKNRVWGFANTPSGRPVVEPQVSWENATGSVQYTYQIASGRAEWQSRDPIEEEGGINLYDYALNDPIDNTDPFGLDVTITLYPGAGGFGHIGTGVNSSTTTGLYPSHQGLDVLTGKTIPGVAKTDTETPISSTTIHTTPAQDKAIQDAIDKAKASPPGYNLYSHNCAQQSSDFLKAGGLTPPRDMKPYDYFNDIKKQYGPPAPPSPPRRGSGL